MKGISTLIALMASALPPPLDLSAWPVNLVTASDQPIAVTGVVVGGTQAEPADLAISFINMAPAPIRYVRFLVVQADCPHSRKPPANVVAYGDGSAFDAGAPNPGDQPLPSGASATVRLSAGTWARLKAAQLSAGCAVETRPQLVLSHVALCDGSGWQGVAGGPEHSIWVGRPWAPVSSGQCAGQS